MKKIVIILTILTISCATQQEFKEDCCKKEQVMSYVDYELECENCDEVD